jgi:hypothetical protein
MRVKEGSQTLLDGINFCLNASSLFCWVGFKEEIIKTSNSSPTDRRTRETKHQGRKDTRHKIQNTRQKKQKTQEALDNKIQRQKDATRHKPIDKRKDKYKTSRVLEPQP